MGENEMSNKKLESLATEFVQAYNDKDFDHLRELLSSTFYFQHHNRNFEFKDPDEFIAMLKQFASELMPNRAFGKPHRVICNVNTVVIEQPWSGTPSVDIPGMGNAGELLSLDLCSVLIFDGELVTQYHDYG
jgi:hypothetical protein